MIYNFRWKIFTNNSQNIKVESDRILVNRISESTYIEIHSYGTKPEAPIPIKDSKILVLKGSGFESVEVAKHYALLYQSLIYKVFINTNFFIRFGNSINDRSFITKDGLNMLEKKHGNKVINDSEGLLIYESDPEPLLAEIDIQAMHCITYEPIRLEIEKEQKFLNILDKNTINAITYYNSASFDLPSHIRFLLLIFSLESLIIRVQRVDDICSLCEEFMSRAKELEGVCSSEVSSLRSGIRDLKFESITSAICDLSNQLGAKTYKDLTAHQLLKKCVGIRSLIVHGAINDNVLKDVKLYGDSLKELTKDIIIANL